MTGARPLAAAALAAAALGAATLGGVLWWRWLQRRRRVWFVRLNDSIPVNAAWWRSRRERSGELLYVAIGDSAAQGIGASRPARSYVGLLARRLREATGRTVRVVNLAVSGATVGLAVRDQLPKLERLAPDIVTVSIGANDIAGWDPERFERHYRALVAALPDHAILADLPSFYILPGQRRVRVANAIVRRLAAERGLEVVRLHARTHRQGAWGMARQFAGDLFHPNDRGYAVWADAFWPAVERRATQLSRNGVSPSDSASPSDTERR